MALAFWFKSKIPDALISKGPITEFYLKEKCIHLYPDIDLVIWDAQNDNLIGCEVKLSYNELYNGIGQALLLLRYVNTSYLVLPKEKENKEALLLPEILQFLAEHEFQIGLIEFSFTGEGENFGFDFEEAFPSKRSKPLWYRDKLIEYLMHKKKFWLKPERYKYVYRF